MADLVASFLGLALQIGKYFVRPIKREFTYLCCFNSNIEILEKGVKALTDARDGLKMRVSRAENNAEVIVPEVVTWLEGANAILVKTAAFDSEIAKIRDGGCLAAKSRFALSKRIRKTAEYINKLLLGINFSHISVSAPPASMDLAPLGPILEFESRKDIEESIMSTLRCQSGNVVGICGMGGVGKTTMAKQVMDKANKENIVDEALMVVVSEHVDMSKIQDEIAEKLGMSLQGTMSVSSKAHKLRTRLRGGKRVLIVLDDVWKRIKLEDLGIPCHQSDSTGCSVIITSRDREVLSAMNAEKIYTLEVLSETEAWELFKSKVGTCVIDDDVLSIAQEVVTECRGLPLALVTVAVALKGKIDPSSWEDALLQLKESNPVDMPVVLDEVYKPLRLSYDLLESESAKDLFLLCGLFPEGENIPLENLTLYAMGLRMFRELKKLEQTRNKMHTLVEMLKSRSLLLDGDREHHVRMHDVIRDLAVFIASKIRLINCSDCTWISFTVQEGTRLSMDLTNPQLQLLWIDRSESNQQIDDNFFSGIRELIVLSIRSDSLVSLPRTTQLLRSLRTLILYECRLLENISIVAELVSLEILSCSRCNWIVELPTEITRLKHLKLLQIMECWNLRTIAPGVISSLIKLEELKILISFYMWEAEGKEGINASLSELQSLSRLTRLEIECVDSNLVAEDIELSQNIVRYDITVGVLSPHIHTLPRHKKKMQLLLENGIIPGNWIQRFVKTAESLLLEGDGSRSLLLSECLSLKWLTLVKLSTLKRLADVATSDDNQGFGAAAFPRLEFLNLVGLDNLVEIWDDPIPEGSDSFRKLEELRVEDLPVLKHLWKSNSLYRSNVVPLFCKLSCICISGCDSLRNLLALSGPGKDSLSRLVSLEIRDCKVMEHVFLWNEEDNEEENREDISGHDIHHVQRRSYMQVTNLDSALANVVFPKLESLELCNLPNLTTFCKGVKGIEFPRVISLKIEGCPNLQIEGLYT